MSSQFKGIYRSPIGLLEIVVRDDVLVSLEFVEEETGNDNHPLIETCKRQLDEYFNGTRKQFELDLKLEGTPFQNRAWEQLQTIPYGITITYGEQARRLGNPNASRAVGGANGKNKIVIVVPCHRVVGSDGTLTGFGAGVWRKKWLLDHERAHQ